MNESTRNRIAWTTLAVICAAALGIRAIHAGDAIGGFHCFNEGWYATLARNYRTHSLLLPLSPLGQLDFNVPPFFSYILYGVLKVFGDNVAAYRGASIFFSVSGIVFLYLIASRFYGRRAALAAAALYAVCPVSVTAGRNIQTDPTYMFFLLLSVHMYLKGRHDDKPSLLAWSGLSFGVALFTKQFAVLWLPALFLWDATLNGGVRACVRRNIPFALCAALPPAPFYLYHVLTGRASALRALISQGQMVVPSANEFRYIFIEMFWGLSPLIAALCLAGAALAVVRRTKGDALILYALLFFFVFFSIWHGHSYYMFFSVPFLCIIAGRAISAIPIRPAAPVVALILVALAAVQTIAFLCTVKYGYNEFEVVSAILRSQTKPLLVLDDMVMGSYQPAAFYYCGRQAEIIPENLYVYDRAAKKNRAFVHADADRPSFLLSTPDRPANELSPHRMMIKRHAYALIVFGRQALLYPESEHFFRIRRVQFIPVAPWTKFGIVDAGYADSFLLNRIEPGSNIPVKLGKLRFAE